MELKVTRSTTATFYGAIKLSELRSFMDAVNGCKGTATVSVSKYAGDMRDGSSVTITVNDA